MVQNLSGDDINSLNTRKHLQLAQVIQKVGTDQWYSQKLFPLSSILIHIQLTFIICLFDKNLMGFEGCFYW